MLIKYSKQPISQMELARLLQRASDAIDSLADIRIVWMMAFSLQDELSVEQLHKMQTLFHWLPDEEVPGWIQGQHQLLLPRYGLRIRWEYAAMQALSAMEIDGVDRIYTGLLVQLVPKEGLALTETERAMVMAVIQEPMVHRLIVAQPSVDDLTKAHIFNQTVSANQIDCAALGLQAIADANQTLHLDLDKAQQEYLLSWFQRLGRNPSDIELTGLARFSRGFGAYRFFGAPWKSGDGDVVPGTLLDAVRQTQAMRHDWILSSLQDYSAILQRPTVEMYMPNAGMGIYESVTMRPLQVVKLQAFTQASQSPYLYGMQASSQVASELMATGCGSFALATVLGVVVDEGLHRTDEMKSHDMGNYALPWLYRAYIRNMNHWGIPTLLGFYRALKTQTDQNGAWGYEQPLCITGGIGRTHEHSASNHHVQPGQVLLILGGDATAQEDFASHTALKDAQRAYFCDLLSMTNTQVQAKVMALINRCWRLGEQNPVAAIENIGLGGMTQAVLKMQQHQSGSDLGFYFDLRDMPSLYPEMPPLDMWASTAQGRYLVAVSTAGLVQLTDMAAQERCPWHVVGRVTNDGMLQVYDEQYDEYVVRLRLENIIKFSKEIPALQYQSPDEQQDERNEKQGVVEANTWLKGCLHILQVPCVAQKSHIVDEIDTTSQGLTVQGPWVGPYRVPVGDCAVVTHNPMQSVGEAMALGERLSYAKEQPLMAARLAVSEALLNLSAAKMEDGQKTALSLVWSGDMAQTREQSTLYHVVQAITTMVGGALNLSIVSNRQSLQHRAQVDGQTVSAPLGLSVLASAMVPDTRRVKNAWVEDTETSVLCVIDITQRKGLRGSVYQAWQDSNRGEDVQRSAQHDTLAWDDADLLRLVQCLQTMHQYDWYQACHDCSDGGLWVALCEMAFVNQRGLRIQVGEQAEIELFHEGPAMLVSIAEEGMEAFVTLLRSCGLDGAMREVAVFQEGLEVELRVGDEVQAVWPLDQLQDAWELPAQQIRSEVIPMDLAYAYRDSQLVMRAYGQAGCQWEATECAKIRDTIQGLAGQPRPKVAILRQPGATGDRALAMALEGAGFMVTQICLQDIRDAHVTLLEFSGLCIPSGHTADDLGGVGFALATEIKESDGLRAIFGEYFHHPRRFVWGFGAGANVLVHLKDLMPGTGYWPELVEHATAKPEHGWVSLQMDEQIPGSMWSGMHATVLAVPFAHSAAKAEWPKAAPLEQEQRQRCIAARFVNPLQIETEQYPYNPGQSKYATAAMTNEDGRIGWVLAHPERAVRAAQWQQLLPTTEADWGPWQRLFLNMRQWVDTHEDSIEGT